MGKKHYKRPFPIAMLAMTRRYDPCQILTLSTRSLKASDCNWVSRIDTKLLGTSQLYLLFFFGAGCHIMVLSCEDLEVFT